MGLVKKNEEKKPEHPRKNIFWTLPRKKKLAKKFNNFFSDVASSASSSSTGVLKRKNQLESLNIMDVSKSTSTPKKPSQFNESKQLDILAFESDEESESEDDVTFSSLPKLLHPNNAVYLAIFINFTLVHSNAEQILFYLITNRYKQGSVINMRKWAYEIYSCFIATEAPLQIFSSDIREGISEEIDTKLKKAEAFKSDFDIVRTLREIFNNARFEAIKIINKQLEEFQYKRRAGLDSLYGTSPIKNTINIHEDRDLQLKTIEKNLMPKLFLMQDEIEQCSVKNPKLLVLVSALSTVVYQIFHLENSFVEPIDEFIKDTMRATQVFDHKGHHLTPRICQSVTYCDFCLKIMEGIAPQGYECGCGIKIHQSCIDFLRGSCILKMENLNLTETSTHNDSRDSSKLYEFVHNALGNRRIENYKRSKTNRPKSDPGLYNKPSSDSSSDDCSYGDTYWTNTVSLELQSLTENAKKRRDVIIEIFETERRHVKVLKLLQNVFLEPLKRSKALSIELSNMLFPPSFFIIKDWHFSFETILKKEWHEQQGTLLEVGSCLSIFDGIYGDILKENAANFCAGQPAALDALREQRSKNETLQRGLLKAEGHKRCKRLQLKDLLITIFQRITKYPLLFERLAKYCEGDDLERVLKALDSSKNILNYINMTVRNTEELKLIRRKLILDKDAKHLNLFSHKLIYDGFLTAKKGAISLRVLLFEKVIVLLHKIDDKYLLRQADYVKVPVIKLHEAIVRPNAANNRSFFLILQNEDISQMIELISTSEDECKSWIDNLNEAIDNASKANQKKLQNESSQLILRSDSKNQLDMSKTIELSSIGQAMIKQTKLIEECFQNSHYSFRNSESSNDDVESLSMSINTLGRLVSQLTMKIAERDHERELYLRENQRLRDNLQK